jgi:hypothetical protein
MSRTLTEVGPLLFSRKEKEEKGRLLTQAEKESAKDAKDAK